MKELLRQLCQLDGVAGYEDEVRAFIEEQARPFADELFTDALGSLFVFKKGEKSRRRPLMVCAHMDEVGFLVRDITEDGMLHISAVGSVDPRVLIGRRMHVGGKKTPGVIALKAVHLTTPEERKIAPALNSLYVDMGCKSKKEAEALAMPGDPVMFDSAFLPFGVDCVKAKALDDRVGCAVMLKLLAQLLPYDTWFVFTVGEEIGSRGAAAAAHRLEPGCILTLEGTTAADMPEIPSHKQSCCQRAGAVVSLMDRGTVYPRAFREKVLAQADKAGVRWQYRRSANGSTDSSRAAEGPGAIAFGLSAPVRYIHCACNVAYLPDVEEVRRLAEIVIKEAGELNV